MHKRHQHLNIPIEIVRTVVAISETGSLSKAGARLGLSQPAVSSQIKRIQALVGGSLFVKTPNGATTTELGKLVLQQARRILDANDQMLRLGGSAHGPQPLRLGMSTLFLERFIKHQNSGTLADVLIQTDDSIQITRGLIEGYIDIACVLENPEIGKEIDHLVVNQSSEQLVWVRAKHFVVSPGAPIPVLTWPGDDWMIRTLTNHGIAYKVAFNSPDYSAKITAAEAGIGLTAIPESMVPASLIRATEYYLPPLPPIKTMLCVRRTLNKREAEIVNQISSLFFKPGESRQRESAAKSA